MTPRQWQTAVSVVIGVAAVLVQFVVLARLPLPGFGLVVVTVLGIGMARGSSAGAIAGFGCGLALGLLPPADGLLGVTAFSLVVVGHLAGRVRDPRGLAPLQLAAIATALALLAGVLDLVLTAALAPGAASLGAGAVSGLLGYAAVAGLVGMAVIPAIAAVIRRVGGAPNRRRRRLGTIPG